MVKRHFLLFIILCLAALLVGCATYTERARPIIAAWSSGDLNKATQEVLKRAYRGVGSKDELVWLLEAGAALRAQGDFTNSQRYFDRAVAVARKFDEGPDIMLARETFGIFSNPETLPYRGRWCERIMLHTYRALNWLALGELERARPELIKAYQYQQEAVYENAKRIEKAREALRSDPNRSIIERTMEDPEFQRKLQSLCPIETEFEVYADYVNPFTVYLDGLYFMYAGSGGSDLERATKSLRRVAALPTCTALVRGDLDQLERIVRGEPPQSVTYVIFETGQGPILVQERIDIPIIFLDVSYVGVALPKLQTRENHLAHLSIQSGELKTTTVPVASMDSIFGREFRDELDVIVAKTLISVVAKGTAAYFVNRRAREHSEDLGMLVRVVTALAQMAVNIADTRCWTTLPKEFQVARVPTPSNRQINIHASGHPPVTINLLDGTINVVYVKSVARDLPLRIHQFVLR